MLDIVSQQIELVRVKKKCVLRGYTVFINVNWAKMHIVKETPYSDLYHRSSSLQLQYALSFMSSPIEYT